MWRGSSVRLGWTSSNSTRTGSTVRRSSTSCSASVSWGSDSASATTRDAIGLVDTRPGPCRIADVGDRDDEVVQLLEPMDSEVAISAVGYPPQDTHRARALPELADEIVDHWSTAVDWWIGAHQHAHAGTRRPRPLEMVDDLRGERPEGIGVPADEVVEGRKGKRSNRLSRAATTVAERGRSVTNVKLADRLTNADLGQLLDRVRASPLRLQSAGLDHVQTRRRIAGRDHDLAGVDEHEFEGGRQPRQQLIVERPEEVGLSQEVPDVFRAHSRRAHRNDRPHG